MNRGVVDDFAGVSGFFETRLTEAARPRVTLPGVVEAADRIVAAIRP